MKRHLFFILGFPPAFMNLLLIGAHPGNLLHYFLSGYVVATLPALAISLTDELMERGRTPVRALWCGLIGGVFAPVAIGVGGLGISGILHTAVCGGLVGFLCAMAYGQTLGRVRVVKRQAVAAKRVFATAPDVPVFVPFADVAEPKQAAAVIPEPIETVAKPVEAPPVLAEPTDVLAASIESSEAPVLADFDEQPESVAAPSDDVVAPVDVTTAPVEAPAVQLDDDIVEAEARPAKSEEALSVA